MDGVQRYGHPWLPTAFALMAGAALVGCGAAAPSPPALAAGEVTVEPGLRFTVEIADTYDARSLGLSGRTEVPPGSGMLFVYDEQAPRSYWMAGMLVPLDLAWIADDRVLAVQTLQPCVTDEPCPTHPSPGPVDAVLEVRAGALAGVGVGAAVTAERG